MQPSIRQKIQNFSLSFRKTIESHRQQPKIKVAFSNIPAEYCVNLCGVLRYVKSVEPAIIEHIKLEKIKPNGKSSLKPEALRALFKAADQKKMNRYIVPSNTHEVRPRNKILGSFIIARTVCLLAAEVSSTDRVPKFSR